MVQTAAGVVFSDAVDITIGSTLLGHENIITALSTACTGCPAGKWSDTEGISQQSNCKDCGPDIKWCHFRKFLSNVLHSEV